MKLADELKHLVTPERCAHADVYNRVLDRIKEKKLTKDENASSHFCTHFVPYDQKTKRVLIVDHKKAGTWLFPGGHIDAGELPSQSVEREFREEMGTSFHFSKNTQPFLITRAVINRPTHSSCKEHFDLWYITPTNEEKVNINMDEFNNYRWVDYEKGKEMITHPNNLIASRGFGKY